MNTHHTPMQTARRPMAALAALAAGALLTVAGCSAGGTENSDSFGNANAVSQADQTLSKAEMIKQGGQICKKAEHMALKLVPRTQHPFADGTSPAVRQQARDFLNGFADALDYSGDGLQGLNAPAEDHALLDNYLADIGVVAQQLRAAATAPADQVEQRANHAFALFEHASKQTIAYGFPKGVCGA